MFKKHCAKPGHPTPGQSNKKVHHWSEFEMESTADFKKKGGKLYEKPDKKDSRFYYWSS